MSKRNWALKGLLCIAAALLAWNLLAGGRPADAAGKREEGPVGTYQIATYSLPPTDTRPNWIIGYYIVDTRTGDVEREEDSIW